LHPTEDILKPEKKTAAEGKARRQRSSRNKQRDKKDEINYKRFSSHRLTKGSYLFFARRITKAKVFLKRILHF